MFRLAAILFAISFVGSPLLVQGQCVHQPVALGDAEHFAILSYNTVTNDGLSRIIGDLGIHPGAAVTGFPFGEMLQGSTMELANTYSLDGKNALGKHPRV